MLQSRSPELVQETQQIIEPHRQLIVSRDVSGHPFAFLPMLCQLYELSEDEVPASYRDGNYALMHSSLIPELNQEIDKAINQKGLEGLHRKHAPGIALIVSQECNLSCSYCLAKQGTFGLPVVGMKMSEIKDRLRQLFEVHQNMDYIKFFGGEPTLAMDLIEEVCAFVRNDLGKNVHFVLTTNGTLNAHEHLPLWKQYGVKITVSVDGPKEIHDSVRVNKADRGSYDQVIEYCNALRSANYPFTVSGVFDERHFRSGLSYIDTIKFLNKISPLSKINFVEALGDAVGDPSLARLDIAVARKEVCDAVDYIFQKIALNWLSPRHEDWVYDNHLFRFMAGIVRETARPYMQACTASALTSILPGGQVMPCYMLAEQPEKHYGTATTPISVVEEKRGEYLATHNWNYLADVGVMVPWYRGVVGDVCVADMLNTPSQKESSPFYKCYQETAVLRILQHIASGQRDPSKQARILHVLDQHQQSNY